MLQCERDNLINLFKIDNCIKRYKIIQFGFNYYTDTSIENFINNYICIYKSSDNLITEEYADFVNCIINSYIPKLKTYLGESNTDLIINNFTIEDCKFITWTSILQCYIRIIGETSHILQSYDQNSKCNSIHCITYEVIKEFAKTLANLIFAINNILRKKIEDHNNHNIELLKKASIYELSNSFEVSNFIESFRSEALCEKSPNSNPDDFIRNYILMDNIDRLISYRYTYFLNRSISSKRDDVYRFLGEDAYKFISEEFKSDNYYGSIKSWDDLIDKYRNIISKCDKKIKLIECKRLYSGDPVSPIEDLQYRISIKLACSLITFVNAIKDVAEKKKANKFSSLFGINLDFTHSKFADVEVGYPRSVKTEEGGYCTIAGASELLGINYSNKPALAMRAMGMIKGKGITPEEFKNLIEKVGSSPLVDSTNKLIEQEKERREKMIDEIAREFNLQLDRISRLNEFYINGKIYKPNQIYNNIFGGNNNMNQKAFTIKDIIFSGDRTIALWENGDKTIVRMQDDETVYDPEKAIMALFMKRVYEMYNLPARQKSMNKDLDKYLAKYNEHKDEIANYLINKKYKKTADDTNKAE